MSAVVFSNVWAGSAPGPSFLVLLALAQLSDDSGQCVIAVGRLAWRARMLPSRVLAEVRQLERRGAIGELREVAGILHCRVVVREA